MINKIKADGAIPIFGIPPMFTSTAETGYGFNTTNYFKGAVYRSTIMRICATNDVLIADVQSDLGKIGADNVQLRDNIHPETLGQIMISKCFARSVLAALTKGITGGTVAPVSTQLTLQNSWVNFGGTYGNAKAIKDENGNVTVSGLVKSGAITNATIVATLPVGYRTLNSNVFYVANSNGSGAYDFAVLDVSANGDIKISKCTYSNWLSLDGIQFNVNL